MCAASLVGGKGMMVERQPVTASCVAGHGSTMRRTRVRRIAIATTPRIVTTTSVFAVPELKAGLDDPRLNRPSSQALMVIGHVSLAWPMQAPPKQVKLRCASSGEQQPRERSPAVIFSC